MQDFSRAMREVARTLNQLFLFEVLLNGLVVFLAVYLVLLFINLSPSWAFVPAAIFVAATAYLRLRANKAMIVEGRHAALREKLRTAADYMGRENPLVEELESDVLREMRNVGISQFVNARGLSYKILVITLLSFGIIFGSTMNLHFIDLKDLNLFGYGKEKPKGAGDFEAVELETDGKIYGNDEVAQLGSEELDIQLKPVDFKVSVKEEGEPDTGKFNDIFPRNAHLNEGEESKENIPKEQQELVKNYFKQLAES